MRKSQRQRLSAVVRYVVLSMWMLVAFFPIYWMVSTSFKPDTQWFAWPPVYFPDPPTFNNYMNVWFGVQEYAETQYIQSLQKPLIALRNSLIIASSARFSRCSSRIASSTITIISTMAT